MPASRPTAANRIAQPTGTSYTDAGLAAGTYYYRVTAEDAAGNVGAASNAGERDRHDGAAGRARRRVQLRPGLGHDRSPTSPDPATTARSRADVDGAGKYGGALTFDGVNDIVNVPDATSLDLTTAMTLEAWVRPTALGNDWRTVLLKEQAGNYVYGALRQHGHEPTERQRDHRRRRPRPARHSRARSEHLDAPRRDLRRLDAHALSSTASRSARRRRPARSRPRPARCGSAATRSGRSGSRATSTRCAIYNRALSAAEIQADMNASVGNPDNRRRRRRRR